MQKRKLRLYQYLKVTASELVPEGLAISFPDKEFQEDYFPATGFILGLLPGEEGIVRVTQVKKNHFHGVLASQKELADATPSGETDRGDWHQWENMAWEHPKWALCHPSPERIPDQCDNFISCGGCRLLHLDYEKTLKVKARWAAIHFQREKLSHPVAVSDLAIIPSPRKFHYRNHVQVHINKNKERGFYAPYSYRTIPFPAHGCQLFEQDKFDQGFPAKLELERVVRSRLDYPDGSINHHSLNTPEDKADFFTYSISYPEGSSTSIRIPNPGFFQVNSSILPQWLSHIESLLEIPENPAKPMPILEIFSGFGFISRLISFKKKIISMGVDISPEKEISQVSIKNNLYTEPDAGFFRNAYISHNLENLSTLHPSRIQRIRDFSPERIIINPPRAGFYPDSLRFFLEEIIGHHKTPLVYSSCNAATMARDLKILEDYGYRSDSVALFDFFPFTAHFEMVASIRRQSPGIPVGQREPAAND